MSASLVGSEMCIRDRKRTLASGVRSWNCAAPGAASQLALRLARGAFCAAVSYTHLTLPTICSV
eukprot:9722256-Alexandrium_andersonii.AAC.1